MLYEKKMLILSGEGKGVVMLEKSGRGVRFSLKTFDMPYCGELKAGVITRRTVNVRDLPKCDDPASVFILDGLDDISELHFAVFDKRLRLYGAIGKKMWEANVMDLLCKNDRRSPFDNNVRLGALPPISTPPRVLPMPDGTGAPQARLSIYGDEALAENDFYTGLDMSERMPVVDKFLDTPRVLNDPAPIIPETVAPRIVPRSQAEPSIETTATNAVDVSPDSIDTAPDSPEQPIETPPSDTAPERHAAETDKQAAATEQPVQSATPQPVIIPTAPTETPPHKEPVRSLENPTQALVQNAPVEQPAPQPTASSQTATTAPTAQAVEDKPTADACGDENVYPFGEDGAEQPWEHCARYLKARSHRTLDTPKHAVKPMSEPADKVKFLRETAFIERARADIEAIFKHGEKDEKLSALLPEIEWVTVHADGFDVSVGRGGAEFLCYAVTGTYSPTSPLGSEAQWLPRDKAMPTGAGYWLIFQSAATGEIIE